jgi:hypothetical protein
MNANIIAVNEITFEQVFLLAQRLPPVDQARLAVRLAPKVEWLLMQVEATLPPIVRVPLRGLLSDLGQAPSAEDIDQVQQEMWSGFAREDA